LLGVTKKSTKLRTGVFSTREIPVLIARAVKRDFFAFFGQETPRARGKAHTIAMLVTVIKK